MKFYKTSSFGNDFIEIDQGELACPQGRRPRGGLEAGADKGALARAICDRQRGVGADGVVFYRLNKSGACFEIFNRDGGEAELSGNGMAGLAAVLLQRRLARSPLALRAAIGRRQVALAGRQGPLFQLDVEIGAPDFADRGFFPFLRRGLDSYRADGVEFHPVSVGNPHAVVLCRELPGSPGGRPLGGLPDAARLEALGRKLEVHRMFPKRVNVEFVAPLSLSRCRVLFYERGVGPTRASSTGSAAVFAVLRRLGLAGDRLDIDLGVETVAVHWREGIHVRSLTRLVCRGEFFV
jgi:diaminopimelate epimerase